MKKKLQALFVALVIAISFLNASAQTQNATIIQPDQTSLATLPDADLIIHINPQRIINDALPRIMPADKYKDIRNMLEQAKQVTGIDASHIEYLVAAVRIDKPKGNVPFPMPDFVFVMRGDFSAEGLIGMARMAASGKLREEKYGSRNINLLRIDEVAKEAEKNPFLSAFAEIAIATLDGNTIALGSPAYVKAAIDAGEGRGRLNPAMMSYVTRDPDVLLSITGEPLAAFARAFGLLDKHSDEKCDWATRFGQFDASLRLEGTAFKLRYTLYADNPETAGIIKNLLSAVLQQAGNAPISDKTAQAAIKNLTITTEGNEVLVQTELSQEMVASLVQQLFAPPPPPPPPPAKPVPITATQPKTATTPRKATRPKKRSRRP